MLQWLIGIILDEIICKSSNWQHIQRLKITILGANWQLFRLERIAKFSHFILSTQNIKFYWFVMKIKKFMLPIWWYNRGWFPLGNKYLGSLFWMGYMDDCKACKQTTNTNSCFYSILSFFHFSPILTGNKSLRRYSQDPRAGGSGGHHLSRRKPAPCVRVSVRSSGDPRQRGGHCSQWEVPSASTGLLSGNHIQNCSLCQIKIWSHIAPWRFMLCIVYM